MALANFAYGEALCLLGAPTNPMSTLFAFAAVAVALYALTRVSCSTLQAFSVPQT